MDEQTDEHRLRWGVLSTANIGRAAVNPAIQASSNGRLVAVASRDAARASAFANAHGIPTAYSSYEALIDDEGIEAVYLPLPNGLHWEWAIRAAQAGKHVLCEKPLALDAAQCLEMGAVADENGVKLMEAFMYRFHPRTERVIEMVRQGDIGDMRVVRSSFTFKLTKLDNIRMDAALGGGALMDVGCYCVNVSRTMAGAEPREVQARARWADTGVDDQLTGILRWDEDLTAHFDCALTMERCESFEVGGTAGYLRVPSAFLPGTEDASFETALGRAEQTTHTVAGADQYRLMVEHFADAALHDRPLRYTAHEAAANMRVIEALYASARDGGVPVRVE